MIQPNGTFQTVTLSAAAEFFGAAGDLHVANLTDQCIATIKNVTPFHHAGANAPSGKQSQKSATGKFFFVQKHRPSAGFSRIVHQKDQRFLENVLQVGCQGNIIPPFRVLRVVAQQSAGIIHNAGNRQCNAVQLLCRHGVVIQIFVNAFRQKGKGGFRVVVQPVFLPGHGVNLRPDKISQSQCDGIRPHGDGQNLPFIRKFKILGPSAAVDVIARIPRRFQNTALTKVLQRPHGCGLADAGCSVNRRDCLFFAVHEGFQNSLPVDQFDISRYGNFVD